MGRECRLWHSPWLADQHLKLAWHTHQYALNVSAVSLLGAGHLRPHLAIRALPSGTGLMGATGRWWAETANPRRYQSEALSQTSQQLHGAY